MRNHSGDAVEGSLPGDGDDVARVHDSTVGRERQFGCPDVAGLERDGCSDGDERAERDGREDARELHGGRKVVKWLEERVRRRKCVWVRRAGE